MQVQRRSGGLTAFALVSLIVAGLGLLSLVGFAALVDKLGVAPKIVEVIGTVSSNVLLVIAALGYLERRRWGRSAGNLYAIISLASSASSVVMFPSALGGGFHIGTLIGLVHPVLTLLLVNTTFRAEFPS